MPSPRIRVEDVNTERALRRLYDDLAELERRVEALECPPAHEHVSGTNTTSSTTYSTLLSLEYELTRSGRIFVLAAIGSANNGSNPNKFKILLNGALVDTEHYSAGAGSTYPDSIVMAHVTDDNQEPGTYLVQLQWAVVSAGTADCTPANGGYADLIVRRVP